MSGPIGVAQVRDGDALALAAASPLATGLLLVAGPFTVPVAVCAGTDRIGPEDTEVGVALRAFLAEDPWAGVGSVRPGGWMFVARDETTIVVGRRRGRVELGPIVTLRRENCRSRAEAMDGPRLVTGVAGQAVEAVYGAQVDGDVLTLHWDSGADLTGAPIRQLADVRVHATPDDVHVLLVSEPNPDLAPVEGWSTGTGRSATTTVRLSTPLGGRRLSSDHQVPAENVALSNGE